jgi:ribokinase
VVGHVEVAEFAEVDHVPSPGEIVHANGIFEEPAGGGGVAAVQLARMTGQASLFTALGDDHRGRNARHGLERLGVHVEATFRPTAQRRAFVFLDRSGERTIIVIGERLGPDGTDPLAWDRLAGADAVYFTAGDDEALRRARTARVLVATSRVLAQLQRVGVMLDALVGSGEDAAERYRPGDLDPVPKLAVATRGGHGGTWTEAGGEPRPFAAAPLPGPRVDAYGCGDTFAAALTLGLGAGMGPQAAIAFAARCGALCLTGKGPYGARLPAFADA